MATTAIMAPARRRPTTSEGKASRSDPTPAEIIAAARREKSGVRGVRRLPLMTAGLLYLSFTPVDWGPVAWLALVPLLLLVRRPEVGRGGYRWIWLGGLAFWLPALQWMRLGDPTMYLFWILLSVYLAFYFPVFVGLTRAAVRTLRLPLVLAAPAVWVGLEYLRAHALTGFAWYSLAHSQHRWIDLIQISDLTGEYGVSFVVVAVSAAAAALLPAAWLVRLRLVPARELASHADGEPRGWPELRRPWAMGATAGYALALVAASAGYGMVRRAQTLPPAANLPAQHFAPGPRVAAIQENIFTSTRPDRDSWDSIFRRHAALTRSAMLSQPDVIVWPEGMFRWPVFDVAPDVTAADLERIVPDVPSARFRDNTASLRMQDIAQKCNAAIIFGGPTVALQKDGMRFYNSAFLATPERGIEARYDKVHRVPFGEYIPMGTWLPWLQRFSPYGDWGLTAGRGGAAFEFRGVCYAPLICYEITLPHVARRLVREARGRSRAGRVDVMLNLSNDGWFHGSSELDQHLIVSRFRAVELRTPLVRSVNTGISAIIDGDGVVRKTAVDPKTKASKLVAAIAADVVPLDRRGSFYLAWGDWFAAACAAVAGAAAATVGVQRLRRVQIDG